MADIESRQTPGGSETQEQMTERHKETWAGVLLTALVLGFLLGAYLLLRVVTNVTP
jgi:hypothetical protein